MIDSTLLASPHALQSTQVTLGLYVASRPLPALRMAQDPVTCSELSLFLSLTLKTPRGEFR